MRLTVQLAILLLIFGSGMQGAELAVLQNGFSIRHERRQVRHNTTRLYLSGKNYVDIPTDQIARFEPDDTAVAQPPHTKDVATPPMSVAELVDEASNRYLIDGDLIASVIQAESRANPHAVSPKGAQGLMQLMPGTAVRLGVNDAFDPVANVDAGTRYLRELLERYDYDLVRALAAYNAGPQRVEQYGGVPPYRETRAYVARIVHDFNRKKLAQRRFSALARTSTKDTVGAAATLRAARPRDTSQTRGDARVLHRGEARSALHVLRR